MFSEHLVDERGSITPEQELEGGRRGLALGKVEAKVLWTDFCWVCSVLTKLSDKQDREMLSRGKRENGGQGNELHIFHSKNQRLQ